MAKVQVVKKFYTDGKVEDVSEQMDLAEMQAFVGGYIEYVPSKQTRRSLVVNEEGTLRNLPQNWPATEIVRDDVLILDAVRGNALLVKS